LIENALIIPTGDEIKEGIVQDTDSPMIMQQLINLNPRCQVVRSIPINDDENAILDAIISNIESNLDIIILIGGSGGGHRYSSTLGKDFTHSALETILEQKYVGEIYGKNGHLWCKLLCGKKDSTLIINVPGPFKESKAAMEAFVLAYQKSPNNLKSINEAMIASVIQQYPVGIVK
jgi:molybdopterin biosynthesis enzyme